MKKYFYSDGKEKHGPLSLDELKEENISNETLIWFEGLEDWAPAGELDEMKPILELSPPPIDIPREEPILKNEKSLSGIKHPDEIDELYNNGSISLTESGKLRDKWNKLSNEEKKECFGSVTITQQKTKTELSADKQEDSQVEYLRKDKDWFIEVEENSDARFYCDARFYYSKEELPTKLRTSILEGKYQKDSKVVIHQKDKNGNWQQSESTLYEIAKSHFILRVLYQPVWSHAMAGLKWGAIVGVALKLIDTLILLGSVDPTLAFLFLAAIVVVFIPRIGIIGVIGIVFLSMKYTRANLFIMGLSAALIGSILGCLPGMVVGGIIGLSKKNSLPRAKDAPPEPDGIVIKAIILPLISGIALFSFYIFVFNPWLITVLE